MDSSSSTLQTSLSRSPKDHSDKDLISSSIPPPSPPLPEELQFQSKSISSSTPPIPVPSPVGSKPLSKDHSDKGLISSSIPESASDPDRVFRELLELSPYEDLNPLSKDHSDKDLISSSIPPPSPPPSPPPTPPLPEELQFQSKSISSSTPPIPRPSPVGSKPLSKDHSDKDLISSSSTLPTCRLRPYQAASKPLSENLKSEIIRLCGDSRRDSMREILEPSDIIDPEDPDSWKPFLNRLYPIKRRYLFPTQFPHVSGEDIDGLPVFELYYIMIKKLDPMREFSSIYMEGTNTDYRPFLIYHRPEGEEIKLNQPLPLKNIFRLPSALNAVAIALSNPSCMGWMFWHEPLHSRPSVVYKKRQEDFKDEITDSVASISCELIESAAVAQLQFTFFDEKGLSIEILHGSIFATTDGKPYTKRLVQQFSSSKPSLLLRSRETVPVSRSVFGVPLGSSLHVQVNLIYSVGQDGPYNMEGGLIFPVPKKTESVEECITGLGGITKMRVKVSWWDSMV